MLKILAAVAVLASAPAIAAQRSFALSDFD